MNTIKKLLALSFSIIAATIVNSCNPASSEDLKIIFEEIQMEGMDKVSIGGNLEVVINSQEEYEQLIYKRFQKPLNDYWNANYESVLQSVKQNNPGLTDKEYEELVHEIFYSTWPFQGTENYTHPKVDFNYYTLLGQDAHTGGCELPEYKIEVEKEGGEYIYRITIKRKGDCEMAILRNKWIVVPKIQAIYNVKFEKIEVK